MDGVTLGLAMGNALPMARYVEYVAPFNDALRAAGCTTGNRAAMFCAQVGHESAGLRYMEEIASGAAYEGRRDLGNVQRGDGRRFKGRGPIQLTGRTNYTAFSHWCHGRGLTPTVTYLVDSPQFVSLPRWGFLAAAWYWSVARPRLNTYADAGDLVAATEAVNGGTNGLADRQARWNRCRALGERLLPTNAEEDDMTPRQADQLNYVFNVLSRYPDAATNGDRDGSGLPVYDAAENTRRLVNAVSSLTARVDVLNAKVDALTKRG